MYKMFARKCKTKLTHAPLYDLKLQNQRFFLLNRLPRLPINTPYSKYYSVELIQGYPLKDMNSWTTVQFVFFFSHNHKDLELIDS